MLIFIDESGDVGFKLHKGSTKYFIVAMVIFREHAHAEACSKQIDDARAKCRMAGEFHFNNCWNAHRDTFFESTQSAKFEVRAIVVNKKVIYSPRLKNNPREFNDDIIKHLLANNRDVMQGASVKIDGSGNRVFKQRLETYLRKHVPELKKVGFADSANNNLIQLADMVVGAIARARRDGTDRKNSSRWRDMIAKRIKNEWNFG